MKNFHSLKSRIVTFILLAITLPITLFSQEYDKKFEEKNRMTLVQKGDKFGFLDDIGDLKIPIIYDEAYNYNDGGYAIVKKDGKYGIINRYGDVVLPLSYDDIFPSISEQVYIVLNNKLFGVVNCMKNPVVVLEPQFTKMKEFNGNLIAIAVKNGKYGIVDEYGAIITDFKYDRIYDFKEAATTFKIIDADGKAKYGVINALGKVKGNLYDGIGNFDSSGRAIMRIGVKYGMVGMSGSEMIEPIYNGIDPVVDGKMLVLKNGKFGLLGEFDEWEDYTGEITYDTIITANKGDGLTPVKKWLTYGFIDETGKLAIPMVFEGYTKFEHGLALIVFNGKYGLINTKSQFVGKAEFEEVSGWENGVYNVKKDGVWGTVDKTGIFKKKLTAEELAAQEESSEDLIGNIQASYNKMQEEERKRNEKVYVAPKGLITLSPVEAKKVGTTAKIYNFTKVDTLHYENSYKQLACIKVGDEFSVISGIAKEYNNDRDEYPAKGGYIMSKINKTNGKYVRGDYSSYSLVSNFEDYSGGFTQNSFVKNGEGYFDCNPMSLIFYDKDGTYLSTAISNRYIFFSAAVIPNTNKYVFLAITGVTKTGYDGQRFGIGLYDKDKDEFTHFTEIDNFSSVSWKMSPYSTKVLITPDNKIFFTYAPNDMNGRSSAGDYQRMNKIDLEKFVANGELSYDWYTLNDDYFFRSLEINSDGTMKGFMTSDDYNYNVALFTANVNAKTRDEFSSSIKVNSSATGDDQMTPYFISSYPLKNGKWMTVGPGDWKDGYQSTIALCYYDSDMSLIRQYRIPTKFEDFHNRDGSYTVNGINGGFGIDGDGASAYYGISCVNHKDMETNADVFYEMNYENCVYQIIPGETENEIYVMTAYAIMKIDLTKFVECKLKREYPDYSNDSSDDSSDDSSSDDDGSSSSSSTSSTKTNSTKTNSTLNSGSTTKEKEFTGNVYFKYDMMGSNSAPERLYIHYGSNGAYKTSTSKGSAATVKCQKGKVYYSLTGEKSDMKEFMELSVDDCGKTFKYTEFK